MNSHTTIQQRNEIIEEFYDIFINIADINEQDIALYNFYNKFALYFRQIDTIKDNNIIAIWIDIKTIYVRILNSKGEFKKALPICKEIGILINKLDKSYNKYNSCYIWYLFWSGVILSNLKKYKESSVYFKELLDEGEITDRNKNWYIYSIRGRIQHYFNIIWVLVSVLYLLDLFFAFLLNKGTFIPWKAILFFLCLYIIEEYLEKKIITWYVNKKYNTNETI